MTETRADKPVSEAQRRAMGAAMSGKSSLGIPKSVGREFIEKDPGGKLPEHAKDAVAAVRAAPYPNTSKPASIDALVDRLDALTRRFDDIMCREDFFSSYDDDAAPKMPKYNKEAVNKAITSAERSGPKISGKGKKLIHSLLKGRHDRDDDGSMNFPARRRDQGSGRQYGSGGRYDDDDISASGARKAAAALEHKGDPYRRDDDHGRGAIAPSRYHRDDAALGIKAPDFVQPGKRRSSRIDDRVVTKILVRDRN